MNIDLKLVSYCTASAIGSAVVTWAFVADHYESKMARRQEIVDRIVNKQTEELYEYASREMDLDEARELLNMQSIEMPEGARHPDASDGTELVAVMPIEEVLDSMAMETESADGVIPPGETPEETENNLRRIIREYVSDESEVDVFVARNSMRDDPDAPVKPYIITQESFAYAPEHDDYDKITLFYYENDQVVLDESEDVVEDTVAVLGRRWKTSFGQDSMNADVVFVRNQAFETDYEVVRETDSELPIHVRYGMPKVDFQTARAAGTLVLRDEDIDRS